MIDETTADLCGVLPTWPPAEAQSGLLIAYGPGAAFVPHDVLWYLDLPKRYAEAAINGGTARNVGQPEEAGPGTTKRLLYIDWPLLDKHRDAISATSTSGSMRAIRAGPAGLTGTYETAAVASGYDWQRRSRLRSGTSETVPAP